jgi:hypothetical protein
MTSAVALLTQVWVGDIVLLACLDNLQECQRVVCVSEDTTCALVACTHAAIFFKLASSWPLAYFPWNRLPQLQIATAATDGQRELGYSWPS